MMGAQYKALAIREWDLVTKQLSAVQLCFASLQMHYCIYRFENTVLQIHFCKYSIANTVLQMQYCSAAFLSSAVLQFDIEQCGAVLLCQSLISVDV